MKLALVFLRQGAMYVQSHSKTTAGVWVFEGGCSKVHPEEPRLVSEVKTALDRSREGVPHPNFRGADLTKSVLDAAGVKNWATFAKGAKAVEVALEQEGVVLTPTRNLGSRDGFVPMSEKALRLRSDSIEEEVQKGLQFAFELCE